MTPELSGARCTQSIALRALIDHVWPRGMSRERAQLDEWARALAPSDELRKWFGHRSPRFADFARATATSSPPSRS